ncbi:helix-turn-helix domain-containing protein [Rhizobium laguerreae]|uniref:helix-turn-helix domain-containing protein n=1 Tax=Rhizobium laguerreae TaxID=1076926 RepID=UPI001C901766|nr:helix-turn-helix domain-containing protein [Rhizobium laguerreae]
MMAKNDIPSFFVYGEPSRSLDVGFLHVETVMARRSVHFGHVAPHKHSSMGQITYWFRGGGVYRIDDQTWNFSAPTISFVPSNVVHAFDVGEQSDAIVVSVSDDLLGAIDPQVALDLDTPILLIGEAHDPGWSRLGATLEMIADEYRGSGGKEDKVVVGLVSVALSMLARLAGARDVQMTSPAGALGIALRRAIDNHYKEDWPVSRYVDYLATTPHLLDRAAREVFGQSVKDLLLDRRLLEAKRLLKFTIRSVEDVGREIGFEDPAYFSRFFRNRAGEAPAAWRRRQVGGEP